MIVSGLVNVYTHDIEAALHFYGAVLELPETFRAPDFGHLEHVELAAGPFVLALSTAEAAEWVHGFPVEVGRPTMNLVFWVDDVDRVFDWVVGHGAPAVVAPQDAENGNRRAVVRDPDGTLVELVARGAD